MGIRYLNKFLKENAKKSIKVLHLSELSGKKIAIDISIYMYKYASDDTLIENIYLMLTVLRYYNIIPIFIFDGKPPIEKKELLQKRRDDKKEAQEEYNKLKIKLELNNNMDENDKQEIVNNMDMLKKNFVSINKDDIKNVKSLIRAYGATYYDAPGEADELCAMLTIKEKVWACLSEDMDMFIYGCPRVIRYLSLLKHNVVLYDMKGILEELDITQTQLREICILSGTDYNMKNSKNMKNNSKTINLYNTLKHFQKYKVEKREKTEKQVLKFYDWLLVNSEYIEDIDLLKNIYEMFDLSKNHVNLQVFENIKIINGNIEKNEIKKILKTDGFYFP
jgi:flap endonuclease-1